MGSGEQSAARRRQRIVGKGGQIWRIDARRAGKGDPEPVNGRAVKAVYDKNDARCAIVVWPALQQARRMKNVLDAMNDKRLARMFGQGDQSFDAQQPRPQRGAQELEK